MINDFCIGKNIYDIKYCHVTKIQNCTTTCSYERAMIIYNELT